MRVMGKGDASVMTPEIPDLFDYAQHCRNRSRAAARFIEFDFLKNEGALRLADRLEFVRRDFPLCLDFGCHNGLLTKHLKKTGKVGMVIQADPTFEFARKAQINGPPIVSEPEQLPFAPSMFDAVFSCLSLHWIDDLPGLLTQMRALLKPDGLLLVSFLGGSTLTELRTVFAEAESELAGGISPRAAMMADIRDVGALLGRAGLALPVADADRLTINYQDLFQLMADLRGMGEQNALNQRIRKPTPRQFFQRAAQIYHNRYGQPDGSIPASFEIITLTGWAPHENQQKPLRPGSALHRLADSLDTTEHDPQSNPDDFASSTEDPAKQG